MNNFRLRNLVFQTLLDLSSDEGINASGKDEVFGCIFGRDSAITILKILRVHSKEPSLPLLEICRRALINLVTLQGKQFNIESGEEPGKFIHEYRKDKYERLLALEKPWYVYPDGILRNYDSIDSTPLGLIAIYKYYQITEDSEFLVTVLPAVEAGLNWLITFGDKDKDLLVEYEFPVIRRYGGLLVQSWTDSRESLIQPDGRFPEYPIAPVEVQGDVWLALRLWAKFYQKHSPEFAKKLESQALQLKKRFNQTFIFEDKTSSKKGRFFASQALDGNKKQIQTITSNPLLLLWSSLQQEDSVESLIETRYVKDLVERSFEEDLFDGAAGIRTMSAKSLTFDRSQKSYHNGSFWPMLNSRVVEGLINWGYDFEAKKLTQASLKPIKFFNCPIELYVKDELGNYLEYQNAQGQVSCRSQAWSAAGILDILTD